MSARDDPTDTDDGPLTSDEDGGDVERGSISRTDEIVLRLLDNMIWPILVIVVVGVFVFVPQTLRNLLAVQLILWAAVPIGLLVLAESLCLISGHFDLSIGAIMGFSAMLAGMLLADPSGCPTCWSTFSDGLAGIPPTYLGIGILVLAGGLIGLANGVMIAKVGLNPFLQTLAFLIIFEGAKTAMQTQPVSGLPSGYTSIGSSPNLAIGILLAIFLLFGIVMRYTRFGQAVYALGSDEHAAREVGIDGDRVTMAVFTISGVLSALAGLMATGFVGIVPPLIGEGKVFQAFAGAVIGGVSLFGGRGKVSGALGGMVLIQLVQSALDNSPAIQATQIQMINGIVLLIAILLYATQERIRARILASGSST